MQTIAVLGLGRMGHGIAHRLIQGGFRVYVWNRNPAKADDLLKAGAMWVESPAAAAQHAQVVISMVSDDAASESVWSGTAGALNKMAAGSFAIECSTLSSEHVKRQAALALKRNISYIDCPVTGWPDAAATGQLTLLVGAASEDLERVRTVLNVISRKIYHFGPVGTGTAYKLMINLMGTVQIAALAEGIVLAERLGLDQETVIAALESGAAASPIVIKHARAMVKKSFSNDPTFTTSLRLKDATYGLSLATGHDSPALLGELAAALFAKANKAGPEMDEATVVNMVG